VFSYFSGASTLGQFVLNTAVEKNSSANENNSIIWISKTQIKNSPSFYSGDE